SSRPAGRSMVALDARAAAAVEQFGTEMQAALGDRLVCLALHGSAAGADFVPGRSDVNTVIVVTAVTPPGPRDVATVLARWRRRGVARPLVVDPEYLDSAREVFPLECEDLRRQHRVLAGRDVLADLRTERAAVRRACVREARAKQLGARALFLHAA